MLFYRKKVTTAINSHLFLMEYFIKIMGVSARVFVLIPFLIMVGCASVFKPDNKPLVIKKVNFDTEYREATAGKKGYGDYRVLLSFSGGGTRAAAFSYGVMQELRDTYVGQNQVALLDEVDTISSVSGGSFTAAYYGVFGDKLFTDYEEDFLRQSVQGTLVRRLLSPTQWYRSIFSGFDRTEMAIDHYDKTIFKGATFGDIDLNKKPYIVINATDLSIGSRFEFTQPFFDLICSDLDTFPVARAVTASSAVPILFPSVVLKNYASECDLSDTPIGERLAISTYKSDRQKILIDSLNTYRNQQKRPYIHLIDGGISDNLGLRMMIDRDDIILKSQEQDAHAESSDSSLIIMVNAATNQESTIDETARKPSARSTISAINNIGISRYSFETIQLATQRIKEKSKKDNLNGNEREIYLVELNFESIETPSLKRYFNNLPTSLELSDEEIDSLIEAGRQLLRNSVEFQSFLNQHGGIRRPADPE